MIRTGEQPQDPADWKKAAEIVVSVTARAFGVPQDSLLAKTRSTADVAYARQVAMYLAHVVFGGKYQDAGKPFGRERTTVAYACSLIEDDRDDTDFDRKLDVLEDCVERLWFVERLRVVRSFQAPRRRSVAA
ncbi:helix-turn-helix domain-containing protein [Parvularcula lutaonensis]|uniref:Helix-turn-helix domain-containing protein n=1 Tax=Parvularcula lutaonensis TaxID=491923 RepID=A0ABV7MDF8_9PROT|nr:helix-turn-helix domain-containing protein [Parvularcula lutaonensis]GGY53013.1 chromosomal replication initiator protein DnaA [Parvularcula lutaonensis]